jgi:alanine racemase
MSRPAQLTIDLPALQHNFEQVKKMVPGRSVIAMVKANAYGHGLERIALALKDAEALGVASFEEGLFLRNAGVKTPILLMEGLFSEAELTFAAEHGFSLVVHHAAHVEMLEKSNIDKPLSVWLKIDTGMHRLGFHPDDVAKMYARLMLCGAVKKPVGLMTHFASSNELDSSQTLQQIELFNQVTSKLEGPKSLANSAGIIAWPAAHGDWVRPGIMLYGASPFSGHRGVEYGLKPVMSLTSQIIAIHQVAKGSRIGYGGTWTCPENTRVGVVAIGYGDGYPRHAVNGTQVLVNGRPCPLAGKVAMDMLSVDLGTQPEARVGDPVTLWGPGLPVEVVAEQSGTTCYELLTRITQRVRVIVHPLEEQSTTNSGAVHA